MPALNGRALRSVSSAKNMPWKEPLSQVKRRQSNQKTRRFGYGAIRYGYGNKFVKRAVLFLLLLLFLFLIV